MTKLFLILLLITKHSFMLCGDRDPDIFYAIQGNKTDFSKLTDEQEALYSTQINSKSTHIYFSTPLECAALWDNMPAVNWLLARPVDMDDKSLRCALRDYVKTDVALTLLAHEASIDFVYDRKKPAAYVQKDITNTLALDRMYPGLRDDDALHKKQQLLRLLKQREAQASWARMTKALLATKELASGHVDIAE